MMTAPGRCAATVASNCSYRLVCPCRSEVKNQSGIERSAGGAGQFPLEHVALAVATLEIELLDRPHGGRPRNQVEQGAVERPIEDLRLARRERTGGLANQATDRESAQRERQVEHRLAILQRL